MPEAPIVQLGYTPATIVVLVTPPTFNAGLFVGVPVPSCCSAAVRVELPAYGSACKVPVLAFTTPVIEVPPGMVIAPLANAVPTEICTPPDRLICSLLKMEQVP